MAKNVSPWERVKNFVLGEGPVPPASHGRKPRAGRTWSPLQVTAENVQWRTRLGRHRTLPTTAIARVAVYTVVTPSKWGEFQTFVALLLDKHGRALLRANRSAFYMQPDPLDDLKTLGIPVVHKSSSVRPKDLRRRLPEAISLAYAYPILAGFATILVGVPALSFVIALFSTFINQ